jgi:hypothetical protein
MGARFVATRRHAHSTGQIIRRRFFRRAYQICPNGAAWPGDRSFPAGSSSITWQRSWVFNPFAVFLSPAGGNVDALLCYDGIDSHITARPDPRAVDPMFTPIDFHRGV